MSYKSFEEYLVGLEEKKLKVVRGEASASAAKTVCSTPEEEKLYVGRPAAEIYGFGGKWVGFILDTGKGELVGIDCSGDNSWGGRPIRVSLEET